MQQENSAIWKSTVCAVAIEWVKSQVLKMWESISQILNNHLWNMKVWKYESFETDCEGEKWELCFHHMKVLK